MRYKVVASAVAAAGMIAVFGMTPASALPAVGVGTAVEKPSGIEVVRSRGYRGHRAFRGSRSFRRHVYRHRGYRTVRPYRSYRYKYVARPYRYYYSAPYVTFSIGRGSCYWLKLKAYRYGSRYWWRRYNACRYGW